jgi:hypothetical protein
MYRNVSMVSSDLYILSSWLSRNGTGAEGGIGKKTGFNCSHWSSDAASPWKIGFQRPFIPDMTEIHNHACVLTENTSGKSSGKYRGCFVAGEAGMGFKRTLLPTELIAGETR